MAGRFCLGEGWSDEEREVGRERVCVRVLVRDDKDFSLTAIRNQGRPSSKQEKPRLFDF